MKTQKKALLIAVLAGGALALSLSNASAAIVCVDNVCWHSHERYEYPPEARVTIHEDSWKWGPSEHYTFREHEGRGYWHGDTWKTW